MTKRSSSTQFLYAYQNAPWRTQLQAIGLIALVVVAVGIIAGVYLNITARAAAIGREIQELQIQKLELERTNSDLQTELAVLLSVSSMEARALELGFTPVVIDQITYITVDGFSGRQEVVIAPPPGLAYLEAEPLPEAFTTTLFDWMGDMATESNRFQQAVSWLEPLITVTPEAR
jgi:hypothetical protein